MPGISLISIKHLLRVAGFLLATYFVVPTVAAAAAEPDAVIHQALDRMFRMDYAGAEARLLEGLPASSPAQPFYAGTVCLNRFLDWGDTTALRRAERYWEILSPRGDPSP